MNKNGQIKHIEPGPSNLLKNIVSALPIYLLKHSNFSVLPIIQSPYGMVQKKVNEPWKTLDARKLIR
jgi:hypothetical protein